MPLKGVFRRPRVWLGSVSVIGVGAAMFLLSSRLYSQRPYFSVKPFTAHVVIKLYGSASDKDPQVVEKDYFRKQDRSFAWVTYPKVASGAGTRLVTLTDVGHYQTVFWESSTNTKTTFWYDEQTFGNLLSDNEDENCADAGASPDIRKLSDTMTLFGHQVTHYQDVTHLGRANISGDHQVFSDLNCFPARKVDRQDDGAYTTQETTALSDSAPSADVFTVAAGAVERSPLAFEQAYLSTNGQPFFGMTAATTREQSYWRHRPPGTSPGSK